MSAAAGSELSAVELVSDLPGSWLVVLQQIESDGHRRRDLRQWFRKGCGQDRSEGYQPGRVLAEMVPADDVA